MFTVSHHTTSCHATFHLPCSPPLTSLSFEKYVHSTLPHLYPLPLPSLTSTLTLYPPSPLPSPSTLPQSTKAVPRGE